MVAKFATLITTGLTIPVLGQIPVNSMAGELARSGSQGILALVVAALVYWILKKDKQAGAKDSELVELVKEHAAEYKKMAEQTTTALARNAAAFEESNTTNDKLTDTIARLQGSVEKCHDIQDARAAHDNG